MNESYVKASHPVASTDSHDHSSEVTHPRVSVVIPAYNRQDHIREAIDSVLAQDFDGSIEIIVVDDGSTDCTAEIARSYRDQVTVLSTCFNQGPAAARNIGIRASHADIIALLDSDDIMLPNRIATQISYLESNPEVGVVFAGSVNAQSHYADAFHSECDAPSYPRKWTKLNYPREMLFRAYLGNQSTTSIRKKALLQVGLYNTSFRILEDWELMVRLAGVTRMSYYNGALAQIRTQHHNRSNSDLAHGAQLGVAVTEHVLHSTTFLSHQERDMMVERHRQSLRWHLFRSYLAWGGPSLRPLIAQYDHYLPARAKYKWLVVSYLPVSVIRCVLWLRRKRYF